MPACLTGRLPGCRSMSLLLTEPKLVIYEKNI
jgi:hypothetical protein